MYQNISIERRFIYDVVHRQPNRVGVAAIWRTDVFKHWRVPLLAEQLERVWSEWVGL